LNGSVAPITSPISASGCATPYFGPSVVAYFSPEPVTLNVFGHAITASMGIIFLPSPYDGFYFSPAPLSFTWTGQ
jgi:hypothetical protein